MERLRPDDPEEIGPYRLIARLGAGGMGVVFLGMRGSKRVAIKVVRSSFLDDPSLRTRFSREIETLQKITSPYVAQIVDSSVEGAFAWHAVEFINGPTLRELVISDGPLDEESWWILARQLREALNSFHEIGIVHRDIKPANIVMSDTGPKIIDFGISHDSDATSLTTTGMVAGSPAWLAPEQLEGSNITAATDLYSMGSVLVFAATGRSPWGQETSMSVPAIYQKILSGDVDLGGLSPEQVAVIEALHQVDPQSRTFHLEPGEIASRSAAARAEARERSAEPAPEPASIEMDSSPSRRFPAIPVFGGIGLVAIALAGLFLISSAESDQGESSATSSASEEVMDDQVAEDELAEDADTSPGGEGGPFERRATGTVTPLGSETPDITSAFVSQRTGELFALDWSSTGGGASTTLHVINPETLAPIGSLPMSDSEWVTFSSLSPDGTTAAFDTPLPEGGGNCTLIDLESGAIVAEYPRDVLMCFSAFSPSGNRFYGDTFYYVRSQGLDTPGQTVIPAMWTLGGGMVARESFSAGLNPSEMVTAGPYLVVDNNVGNLAEPDTVTVVQQATGQAEAEISVGPNPSGFQVSPDGSFVYFVTEFSSELWVLNLDTLEIDAVIPTKEFPTKTAMSPNGDLVAIAHAGERGISIVDVTSREVVQEFDVEVSTDVVFSRDGSRLFVVGDDSIVIFDKAG